MLHAFYVPDFDVITPTLGDTEGFHAHKVLRIRIGETLWVLDGKGGKYLCRLLGDKATDYPLAIEETTIMPAGPFLHLLVAPPKQGARLSWLVEKSAELGVRRLSFVETTRVVRKTLHMEHLSRIAIAALKQSGQLYKMELDNISPLSLQLDKCSSSSCYVATVGASSCSLPRLQPGGVGTGLIGPEGGLTQDEQARAEAAGFCPFSMGAHTLRTETAVLVVAAWLLRPF